MSDGNPSGQIQEFIQVLKRRRWQILLPALFVLTFGSALAVIIPKKYVVDTRIKVNESRNPFDQGLKNRNESATSREMGNVVEHVINYGRIERIVGKQLIDQWEEYDRADLQTRRDILEAIMKNLSVDVVAKNKEVGSTYLDITYRDVDGKRAVAFLSHLNTGWIEDIIAGDLEHLEIERDVLSAARDAAEIAFRGANQKWVEQATLMRVNPSQAPDAQDRFGNSLNNFEHDQLSTYKRQQEINETDLELAQKMLEGVTGSFELEPDTINVPVIKEGTQYRKEILEAEKRMENLKTRLSGITTLHSEYRAIKLQMEQLQTLVTEYTAKEVEISEVMKPERNERKDDLRRQVDEASLNVQRLKAEGIYLERKVREYQNRVDRKAEEFGLLATLWHTKEEAQKDRALAAEQLRQKESAIRLFRETTGRVYEVVKPPQETNSSREPSAALLVALALFLGGALGMGIALIAEYGRNSYRTVSELSSVMTVPVLGMVGAIVTRAQARKTGARRTVVGVSSAVILLGIAWITFTWYDEERRNQLPVSVVKAIDDFRLMLM